jgi:hypothetical protein
MKKIILTLLLLCLISSIAFAKPHETQWTPDTHNAVIVVEWDDEVPAEERVTTFKRFVKKDESVKDSDAANAYRQILEENQRKNKAIGRLMEEDGTLKADDVGFYYDAGRKLHLTNIATDKKADANTKLKSEFGNDKIEVE